MPAQTGLMLSSEMLNDLLSAGILTQSEYDAISALQTSQQGMGNPPSGGPGGLCHLPADPGNILFH